MTAIGFSCLSVATWENTREFAWRLNAIRDVRDNDHGRGHDRDPIRACVQSGLDLLPNNRYRIAHRHGEARPTERPDTAAWSNNPDAICNACPRDTNNLQPIRIQVPDLGEEREPREVWAADQF